MAKPQKQEPCPRCNAEVEIYAADGGGRGSMTIYGARCKCGLDEYGFSNDGTRRSAISTWNRWAREEKAKRAAPGVAACVERLLPACPKCGDVDVQAEAPDWTDTGVKACITCPRCEHQWEADFTTRPRGVALPLTEREAAKRARPPSDAEPWVVADDRGVRVTFRAEDAAWRYRNEYTDRLVNPTVTHEPATPGVALPQNGQEKS